MLGQPRHLATGSVLKAVVEHHWIFSLYNENHQLGVEHI